MTTNQRNAIDTLFLGGYLRLRDRRKTKRNPDFCRYTLYDNEHRPLKIFHGPRIKKLLGLCKTSTEGVMTLNLNLVRQLRGNSYIKMLYVAIKQSDNFYGASKDTNIGAAGPGL
jgi:hypothetical protein